MKWYQFFKLIRTPNLFIILATHYFSALFLFPNNHPTEVFTDINVHLLGFIAVLTSASGYIINDYFDIKIDFINNPEKVIIGKYISRRWAIFFHYLFIFTALFLAYFVRLKLVFIVGIISFLLWLYALKLKRTTFLGNFLVAFLTAMVIGMLIGYYDDINPRSVSFFLFAFTSNLIREIIKDMEDIKGDKAQNCKTLPIVFGIPKTKWIAGFFIILFLTEIIVYGWVVSSWKMSLILAGFSLFLLMFSIKLIRSDNKDHFHELSTWAKWMMLGGILLMAI